MTELIKIDAAAAAGTLSTAVTQARKLVDAASEGICRDLVQVQAAEMIRQALTPEVKALILAAGKCGQYEVVQYGEYVVKPDAQIGVCVQAVTMGLRLNGGQFSVWGDWKGEAKLYLKSAGFRQLLQNTGRATMVRVHVGFPEFVVLGKSKKGHDNGVAYMTGEASCLWDGVRVEVTAPEAFRIGIPWTATDNTDGIVAKGERRMLARLWAACSGQSDPEEACDVTDVEYSQVESSDPMPASEPEAASERDWDSEKERFVAEYQQIKDDPLKTLYLSVMRASDENAVKAAMEAAATAKLSAKERNSLQLARDWQLERIAAGAV